MKLNIITESELFEFLRYEYARCLNSQQNIKLNATLIIMKLSIITVYCYGEIPNRMG
jgi:hypothetical protein